MKDYKVVKEIKMTTEQLKGLLEVVRKYKYYYVYDSEQNRDGQGEWHCDVFLDDEVKLGEDGWGDGVEYWSFDEVQTKNIPVTEVREYCVERDLPQIKTIEDLKNWCKYMDVRATGFMRDGKVWIRTTTK